MASYDDLKRKAKDAFDTIADVSVEAYKLAEEKAKILARRTKLNADITREKVLIRRLKAEIGGLYYDLHKDDPEEAFKQGCDSITASLESIAAKRRELDDLRNANAGSCCCDTDEATDAETEPCDDADTAGGAGTSCDCGCGGGAQEPEHQPEHHHEQQEQWEEQPRD